MSLVRTSPSRSGSAGLSASTWRGGGLVSADGARRLWDDGRHPGGSMRHTVLLIVLLAGCSSNTGPSPSSMLVLRSILFALLLPGTIMLPAFKAGLKPPPL